MRETVFLALGGVVAFALQAVLSPNISILGAMPNFALVYVAVASMLRQTDAVITVAFFLGLACDLADGSTVGVTACLLTLASFAASRSASLFGNDTVAASMLISVLAALLMETCYALFYVAVAGVPLGDALLLRALPCALYDCAMVLVALPILSALVARQTPSHAAPSTSTVRLR